jgi:hypothetical protein
VEYLLSVPDPTERRNLLDQAVTPGPQRATETHDYMFTTPQVPGRQGAGAGRGPRHKATRSPGRLLGRTPAGRAGAHQCFFQYYSTKKY